MSHKMIASGFENGTEKKFKVKFNGKQAINIMLWTAQGQDAKVDKYIESLTNKHLAKVLSAFAYIDFADKAEEMLKSGKRFAIKASEATFGLGTNEKEAETALGNEEF